MNELSWIAPMLLTVRGISHFLIFLRVVTYSTDGHGQHRKVVGLCAALFAGFNLAESVRILNNFSAFVVSVEPYLPGVMLMVLVFVIWSGGNVAKFLPRKIIERLP